MFTIKTLTFITALFFSPAVNAYQPPVLTVQQETCQLTDDYMLHAAQDAAIKVNGKVVVLKGDQADAALQVYMKDMKEAGAVPDDAELHTDALIAIVFKAEGSENETVYVTIHRDGCFISPVRIPVGTWRKMYTEA